MSVLGSPYGGHGAAKCTLVSSLLLGPHASNTQGPAVRWASARQLWLVISTGSLERTGLNRSRTVGLGKAAPYSWSTINQHGDGRSLLSHHDREITEVRVDRYQSVGMRRTEACSRLRTVVSARRARGWYQAHESCPWMVVQSSQTACVIAVAVISQMKARSLARQPSLPSAGPVT